MSDLEKTLEFQLRAVKIGGFEREYRFAGVNGNRRWRWDFYWPHKGIAVEINGGIYQQGRHNRGAQMEKDYDKHNEALLMGIKPYYFGPQQIHSGQAVRVIETALYSAGNGPKDAA